MGNRLVGDFRKGLAVGAEAYSFGYLSESVFLSSGDKSNFWRKLKKRGLQKYYCLLLILPLMKICWRLKRNFLQNASA